MCDLYELGGFKCYVIQEGASYQRGRLAPGYPTINREPQ